MAPSTPPGNRPATPPGKSPATWVAVTILLLIGIFGTLWVPIYARTTPMWGDFPFFYWYQLVWVPVVAVLSYICYLLLRTKPASRAAVNPPASGGEAK